MSERQKPIVSVVICTYNPREDHLSGTLESLKGQSLSREFWELVLVDNASENGIPQKLSSRFESEINLRRVGEPEKGLIFARRRGFLETAGELLVLVDDDNLLDEHYLEKSLAISMGEPGVGAFGGISEGVYEKKISRSLKRAERFLAVRNFGDKPVTKRQDKWGVWEPIGAGMAVQRRVADRFLRELERIKDASLLGRKGGNLASGEDSFLARCSYLEGMFCGYRPELRLRHLIPKERVRFRYLCKLSCGQGRAAVVLDRIRGRSNGIGRKELIPMFRRFVWAHGIGGVVDWSWHLGRYLQAREFAKAETED